MSKYIAKSVIIKELDCLKSIQNVWINVVCLVGGEGHEFSKIGEVDELKILN